MQKSRIFIRFSILLAFACSLVQAGHIRVDTIVGSLKIELHVLAAEPFFTKDEASAKKVTEGMLIMGGAKPLAPDAETHPNHHLVIHVFNVKTSKAITTAKVKMTFQSRSEKGDTIGGPINVPVVVMQAIGKGEQSTHYGNNVVMADGPYAVTVVVNGKKASFKITVSGAASD